VRGCRLTGSPASVALGYLAYVLEYLPIKSKHKNVLPEIREDVLTGAWKTHYGRRPSLRAADTASSRLCTESLAMAF